MPGFPRDLAVLEPWEVSSIRSRERRQRTARGRTRTAAHTSSASLSAMLDARNRTAARDLAEELPWDLSLGRSRARRRAAELRFVPASSRAKRISLGALAALTAGPTASLADRGSGRQRTYPHARARDDDRTRDRAELRQRRPAGAVAPAGPRSDQSRRCLRAGNRRRRYAASRSSHGLAVDGIVGPLTSAALRGTGSGSAFAADVTTPIPAKPPPRRRTALTACSLHRHRAPVSRELQQHAAGCLRHQPAAPRQRGRAAAARAGPPRRRGIRPRDRGGDPSSAGPPRADRRRHRRPVDLERDRRARRGNTHPSPLGNRSAGRSTGKQQRLPST